MWKNSYKDLFSAIRSNNFFITKELLEGGCSPDVDTTNFTKLQPLELAIDNCNVEIVKILLQYGASIKSASSSTIFLQRAVLLGNQSIIAELINHNFDWRALNDETGDSLMHWVFKVKGYHRREDLTLDHIESWSHLKSMAEKQIIELLKIFLDLGRGADIMNYAGETCLFLADKKRMSMVSNFLMDQGAQIDIFIHPNDSFVLFLIEGKLHPSHGRESENLDQKVLCLESMMFMEWYLSKDECFNRENYLGKNSFLEAANFGLRHLLPSLMDCLAKYLKNINDTDEYDEPPLHILFKSLVKFTVTNQNQLWLACYWCEMRDVYVSVEYVKELIYRSVNIETIDKYGYTLLHAIVQSYNSNETKETLNAPKETPQAKKRQHWEIEEIETQSFNSTLNIKNLLQFIRRKDSKIPTDKKIIDLLLNLGCKVDAINHEGKTTLYLTVEQNTHWLVKYLIKNDTNVDYWNPNCQYTALELADYKNYTRIMKMLIRGGVKINRKHENVKSILHLAMFDAESTDGLKLLLKMGADVNSTNGLGRTPIRTALACENIEAMKCLVEFGAEVENVFEISKSRNITFEVCFMQYIAMHVAADLPISDKIYNYCCMNYIYLAQYMKCLDEIEKMKKTFLEGSNTFYDFFHMNPDHKLYFALHKKFKVLMEQFPNCRTLISAHYWMAFERKTMTKAAIVGWLKSITNVLPDLCVERILNYLENWQLKLFVEEAYKN